MSLLNLKRHQSCPLFFDFHGQALKVVDHNGRPYFTAETIGKALGYAYPRESIMKIYERNKSDFGADETTVIEMEVEINGEDYRGQIDPGSLGKHIDYRSQFDYGSQEKLDKHTRKIQVRIFSLRGAHHFGFFAKTELGKEYRQWVLDLIEARHEESSYHSAFSGVVGVLSDEYPLWQKVHSKFTAGKPLVVIASDLNISVSRVSRAIKQMRHYKVLTEAEYQRYRKDGRFYLKALRDASKAGSQ